ncbi:MAG: hypothetical protein MJY62_03785 [Bacteroidales bacterium]|nr:hypothetical protein [Bacteroidales bacterium]
MNVKAVSRYVGMALLVSAFFMLLSIAVSVFDGFDSAFTPLLVGFLMTLSLGAFPFIFVQGSQALTIREGYVVIIISWFLSFLLGMIPYVIWGGPFNVVNAWFESVSGYTTTGSTILSDIEQLPRSLLLWRSSTHFIGGLGVVVFLLMVIPPSSPLRMKLSNLELSSLSRDTFNTRMSDTLRIIITVYIGLFVVMTALLVIAGMPVFDAVNHAFSTVATGGFSIKNESVGFYGSGFINIIFVVFMILASCHFALIYYSVANRSL